jgi:outer membrane protein assembly factor BamB
MMRMTKLDPEQRPASVAEVQAELQAIASRSPGNRVGFQPRRPPRDERRVRARPPAQTGSEARQEHALLPPENPSRRRFVIGGLLTGAALAAGAGSLLALLSHQRALPVRPATTIPASPPAPAVMFGFDAQHTRFNSHERILSPANVSHLTTAWRSQPIGPNYFSSPTVSGDLVYVGSYDGGRLYALDAATGQTRWVSDQHGFTSTANGPTPAVANGMVYSCFPDNRLYAFDALTGKLRWVSQASNAVDDSPTIVNGVIYLTGNGSVYAFDAATGKLNWLSSPPGGAAQAVAVADGLVYVTIQGHGPGRGLVDALDAATGQARWQSDLLSGGTDPGVDPNSSPTVANGLVYIGSGNGGLAAFDAATGHVHWVTSPTAGSTGSSPAVAQGIVYMTGDAVYAFDAITGRTRWRSNPIGAFNADPPLVANGVVYIASQDRDGKVYAFRLPSALS